MRLNLKHSEVCWLVIRSGYSIVEQCDSQQDPTQRCRDVTHDLLRVYILLVLEWDPHLRWRHTTQYRLHWLVLPLHRFLVFFFSLWLFQFPLTNNLPFRLLNCLSSSSSSRSCCCFCCILVIFVLVLVHVLLLLFFFLFLSFFLFLLLFFTLIYAGWISLPPVFCSPRCVVFWFYHFTVVLVLTNSCINPFIYAAKYREFQNGVRSLIACISRKPLQPVDRGDQSTNPPRSFMQRRQTTGNIWDGTTVNIYA